MPSHVPPSAAFHRTFRCHADTARRHHQFTVLVAIFGNTLAERQLAGALALAFPRFARPALYRQHTARAQRAVIFEMLLRMQAAAAAGAILDTARCLAGAEPGLAWTPTQRIVRIELGHRLREGGRSDYAGGLGLLRGFGVVIDGVHVADRTREQHDVARFDGEGDFGQALPPWRWDTGE